MLNGIVTENYIFYAFYYEIFFIFQLEILIQIFFTIFYFSVIEISRVLSPVEFLVK